MHICAYVIAETPVAYDPMQAMMCYSNAQAQMGPSVDMNDLMKSLMQQMQSGRAGVGVGAGVLVCVCAFVCGWMDGWACVCVCVFVRSLA